MLQPVVGGFSPEMDRLNPERNPWPKGHATPVVGGFSPEMDRFNTEIDERKPHGLKAMLQPHFSMQRPIYYFYAATF
ncbi:hypothetical protein [Aliiglaciecola lipolytica]|uniref:hypothetical protein n=1 Tax=Aliiglaciecola lipolytica TaxID=477689 RepID=UPI001C08AA41|nr:hypothetical protein [Aliiglaciecola lipolytica]MBU2877740.1 hypothetical protein [Aliiglaciecola lipolytica]